MASPVASLVVVTIVFASVSVAIVVGRVTISAPAARFATVSTATPASFVIQVVAIRTFLGTRSSDAFACTQVVTIVACSWTTLAIPVVILVWMVTLAIFVRRAAVAGFSDLLTTYLE